MGVLASPALSEPPFNECAVGSQPSQDGNSEWMLSAASDFEARGFDSSVIPGLLAKDDSNGDGRLCVMAQILSNDAPGFSTYYILHDNPQRRR
jgi:hypothetical protein